MTIYVEDWPEPEQENPEGYLAELGANIGALHRVVIDKTAFEDACREAGLAIKTYLYRSETVTLQSAYVLGKFQLGVPALHGSITKCKVLFDVAEVRSCWLQRVSYL